MPDYIPIHHVEYGNKALLQLQLCQRSPRPPGGGDPAARDDVRTDELLGAAGHGVRGDCDDGERGVRVYSQGRTQHVLSGLHEAERQAGHPGHPHRTGLWSGMWGLSKFNSISRLYVPIATILLKIC